VELAVCLIHRPKLATYDRRTMDLDGRGWLNGRQWQYQAHPIRKLPHRHGSVKGGEPMFWNSIYQMASALVARARNEDGQTMAEYGLLLAVIAVVVVAAAIILGTDISSLFVKVGQDL
jgi:pilus assembly protein Flp/PilA